MIQRIQSIYLFIGMVIGIGSWLQNYTLPSIALQVSWISTLIFLFVGIISYKNRRLQIILTIFAGLTFLLAQIYLTLNFQTELKPIWTGITIFIFYVILFLAIKNIKKDQKLIRDTNRLR
ncbi:MAG: hypothetical protein RLZZ248_931 [Bacteroidota bacterium]|jgi:ABC-type Co2+ transport system permease subunit